MLEKSRELIIVALLGKSKRAVSERGNLASWRGGCTVCRADDVTKGSQMHKVLDTGRECFR